MGGKRRERLPVFGEDAGRVDRRPDDARHDPGMGGEPRGEARGRFGRQPAPHPVAREIGRARDVERALVPAQEYGAPVVVGHVLHRDQVRGLWRKRRGDAAAEQGADVARAVAGRDQVEGAVAVELAHREPDRERGDRVARVDRERAVPHPARALALEDRDRVAGGVDERDVGDAVAVEVRDHHPAHAPRSRAVDRRQAEAAGAVAVEHGQAAVALVAGDEVELPVAVHVGERHDVGHAAGRDRLGGPQRAVAVAEQHRHALMVGGGHDVRVSVAVDVGDHDAQRQVGHRVGDRCGERAAAQADQHADRRHAVVPYHHVGDAVEVEVAGGDAVRVRAAGDGARQRERAVAGPVQDRDVVVRAVGHREVEVPVRVEIHRYRVQDLAAGDVIRGRAEATVADPCAAVPEHDGDRVPQASDQVVTDRERRVEDAVVVEVGEHRAVGARAERGRNGGVEPDRLGADGRERLAREGARERGDEDGGRARSHGSLRGGARAWTPRVPEATPGQGRLQSLPAKRRRPFQMAAPPLL